MPLVLLAALLPGLFWDQQVETAPALKQAGIARVCVPPEREADWRKAGFTVVGFKRESAIQAVVPGVEFKIDEASATRMPWLDANGWRFERESGRGRTYYYDAPQGKAALAAAEAFAYGVEAVVRAQAADLPAFARMLTFLGRADAPRMPVLANIGVVDDGSEETGEVLNLMARRNLLFRVLRAPEAGYDLVVKPAGAEAADPFEYAATVRQKLGDERRLLRIYGSDVVLGRLTGEGGKARLHLINYGERKIAGLRVRVRGAYAKGTLVAFGLEKAELADYTSEGGATEFTIPEMPAYTVVDLK